MASTSEAGLFGLDPWERDLLKMGVGWTLGMLLGIAALLTLLTL